MEQVFKLLLCFTFFLSPALKAQMGVFEVSLDLVESEARVLRDTILSALKTGNCLAFEGRDFSVPLSNADAKKRTDEKKLGAKKMTGLRVIMNWDIQRSEITVMGYAPLFLKMDAPPFYVAGSF